MWRIKKEYSNLGAELGSERVALLEVAEELDLRGRLAHAVVAAAVDPHEFERLTKRPARHATERRCQTHAARIEQLAKQNWGAVSYLLRQASAV